jgi:hypothetical protein
MSFCDLEKALKNIDTQNIDYCNITDPLCDLSDNEDMDNDDLAVPAFNFSFNPHANFVNTIEIDGGAANAQNVDFLACKPRNRKSVCDMKLIVSSKVINQEDYIRPEPVGEERDPWGGAFEGFTPYARLDSVVTAIAAPGCTNNVIDINAAQPAAPTRGAENFCTSVEVDNNSQRTEAGSEEIAEKVERPASFASKDAVPKIVVEEKAKHFIRLFRRSLKRQFDDIYKRKHYHWVDSVVREKTNKFFTTTLDIAGITPELYKENECNFFMLMHPSVDRKVLKKSKRNDEPWFEQDSFAEVYGLVFGQHPSKKNLCRFFSNKIIQLLWTENFLKSDEFNNFQDKLGIYGEAGLKRFKKYFKKIEAEVFVDIYVLPLMA